MENRTFSNMPLFAQVLKSAWQKLVQKRNDLQPWRDRARESNVVVIVIVFLTNMVDNLLLTSVGKCGKAS